MSSVAAHFKPCGPDAAFSLRYAHYCCSFSTWLEHCFARSAACRQSASLPSAFSASASASGEDQLRISPALGHRLRRWFMIKLRCTPQLFDLVAASLGVCQACRCIQNGTNAE
jgi:hypothetical protein